MTLKKIFAVILLTQLSLPKLEARNIVNEQTDLNLVKINDTKNYIIGNPKSQPTKENNKTDNNLSDDELNQKALYLEQAKDYDGALSV